MFRQTLIVPVAALALAAGAAFAQSSTSPAGATGAASGMSYHHHGADLAQLKTELKITSAQEGAWDNFTAALKALHHAPAMHHSTASTASAPVPAPQVFSMMARHAQDFAAGAQKLSRAANALYQALTPTQQQTFNAQLAKMHAAMMHHHHHWQKNSAPASST